MAHEFLKKEGDAARRDRSGIFNVFLCAYHSLACSWTVVAPKIIAASVAFTTVIATVLAAVTTAETWTLAGIAGDIDHEDGGPDRCAGQGHGLGGRRARRRSKSKSGRRRPPDRRVEVAGDLHHRHRRVADEPGGAAHVVGLAETALV